MAVSTTTVRESELGRDARTTLGFVAVALGLAAGVGGVAVTSAPRPPAGLPWLLVAVVVLGCCLAAANAYLNRGVVVSVLFAWSGLLPIWVPFAVTDAPNGREPTVASAVGTLLWGPAIHAVVVGVGAYAVGVAVHHVQGRLAG
jgi:hypothetical protein